MTIIVGVVVIATGFCLGMLIGITVTSHHMRRRIHRNGIERRELADERSDLERRRRLLDG